MTLQLHPYSCNLDLSTLERERTHETWQVLEDGFGSLHFSVTICTVGKLDAITPEENEKRTLENDRKNFVSKLRNLYKLSLHIIEVSSMYVPCRSWKILTASFPPHIFLLHNSKKELRRMFGLRDWSKKVKDG